MCGILGAIDLNIDKSRFCDCLTLLKHRGPDGSGIYYGDRIALGHRRLAILDTSNAADQPMRYSNGRYCIVYNGEIYNFIEVRIALKAMGYFFDTNSDTEVVLAAYDAWGEACLDHFNGMWAFAIWDSFKKQLFLARDRFGIKPLYYSDSFQDGGIIFGSEMKALIPMLDKTTINNRLVLGKRWLDYESTEECLVNEIKRIPAGCYGYYSSKTGLSIKKWWETLDNIPEVSSDYREQVELFRELFLDSCKIRMRSDVTLGTALSGGLDSSATICTMSYLAKQGIGERESSDWQHAFVASFPNTSLDETVYAKKVTDYIGIKASEIIVEPWKKGVDYGEYFYMFEELHSTSPIPMMDTYCAMNSSGVKVSLDGHGADELFGGYSFDFFEAFPDTKGNREEILNVLRTYSDSFPHDGGNLSVPDCSNDYSLYYKYMYKWYKSEVKSAFCGKKKDKIGVLDNYNNRLYQRTHNDVLPTLLRNYDKYSMAHGVEVRMPFMDYRLVSLAFAINWKSKLRNGYSKAIVRDSLRDIIPTEIVNRKTKIGFNSPIVEWMKGPMKEYFLDTIYDQAFSNSCLIDNPKQIREDFAKFINSDKATYIEGESMWNKIVPYLWEKEFYKRAINF